MNKTAVAGKCRVIIKYLIDVWGYGYQRDAFRNLQCHKDAYLKFWKRSFGPS
jgi:hypothetical protein